MAARRGPRPAPGPAPAGRPSYAVAFASAVGEQAPERAERLALAALADGSLLASGHGLAWSCALIALTPSGSAQADALVEAARAEAYRRGSTFETSSAEMFGGFHALLEGDLDEAAELLATTPARLEHARALTARERRVAGLAADGATNREIARSLFVTPKTVEVHLSSAYRKLAIRSRRDLPAALTAG